MSGMKLCQVFTADAALLLLARNRVVNKPIFMGHKAKGAQEFDHKRNGTSFVVLLMLCMSTTRTTANETCRFDFSLI